MARFTMLDNPERPEEAVRAEGEYWRSCTLKERVSAERVHRWQSFGAQ